MDLTRRTLLQGAAVAGGPALVLVGELDGPQGGVAEVGPGLGEERRRGGEQEERGQQAHGKPSKVHAAHTWGDWENPAGIAKVGSRWVFARKLV